MEAFRAAVPSAEALGYCRLFPLPADLPAGRIDTVFNGQFRLPAGASFPRRPVALRAGTGMLTRFPFGFALRLNLRPRLTPIRRTLMGKP